MGRGTSHPARLSGFVALVLMALMISFLESGCGSSDARGAPSRIVVSAKGRIGPLRLDASDRAAVVAFLGHPDAERHARYRPAAPYDALGYRCQGKYSEKSYQLAFPHPPYCRTIFWIDAASGRLESFYSSERRFVDAHGVRIGMPTAAASRLLHSPVHSGCGEGVFLSSKRARLTIEFVGGVQRGPKLHIVGGHVAEFVLHSRLRDPGVFDCL